MDDKYTKKSTLEDWILRVRKTVVVDGDDELMNAEAFQKALEAEKAHFAEKKKKQEEERKKKEELERKLKEAEQSSSEEEVYDKDEAAKNKRKRRRKQKKKGDGDNDDNDDEEEGDDEKENTEKKEEETVDNTKNEEESKKEEDKSKTNNLTVETAEAQAMKSGKRKSSINPEVLKARDVSSQLCYESITLIKRPDTDLVWVLVEPRLKGKR